MNSNISGWISMFQNRKQVEQFTDILIIIMGMTLMTYICSAFKRSRAWMSLSPSTRGVHNVMWVVYLLPWCEVGVLVSKWECRVRILSYLRTQTFWVGFLRFKTEASWVCGDIQETQTWHSKGQGGPRHKATFEGHFQNCNTRCVTMCVFQTH